MDVAEVNNAYNIDCIIQAIFVIIIIICMYVYMHTYIHTYIRYGVDLTAGLCTAILSVL
jgi:hypothetical protein